MSVENVDLHDSQNEDPVYLLNRDRLHLQPHTHRITVRRYYFAGLVSNYHSCGAVDHFFLSKMWTCFWTLIANATRSCHSSFDCIMLSTRKCMFRMLVLNIAKRLQKKYWQQVALFFHTLSNPSSVIRETIFELAALITSPTVFDPCGNSVFNIDFSIFRQFTCGIFSSIILVITTL